MASPVVLTSDDERVAFAAELGWDPSDRVAGDAGSDGLAAEAERFFTLENLAEVGGEDALERVSQDLLDEVRDAVLRRAE